MWLDKVPWYLYVFPSIVEEIPDDVYIGFKHQRGKEAETYETRSTVDIATNRVRKVSLKLSGFATIGFVASVKRFQSIIDKHLTERALRAQRVNKLIYSLVEENTHG